MKLLPKQLWKDEFIYSSDKSVDELKTDIQQLFDNTKGRNFSVNLTGEFTSEFEFTMTPKWQFGNIRNFERKASYLNGQIHSDKLKRTLVTFTVRPNSLYLIFFFLFPLLGISALPTDNINGNIADTIIEGLIPILLVPSLMLILGHFAKQRLKNRFIQTFDLKPI